MCTYRYRFWIQALGWAEDGKHCDGRNDSFGPAGFFWVSRPPLNRHAR